MDDDEGFWDKDGQPIELRRMADLFNDLDYRYVGKTEIAPADAASYIVGTIWLGFEPDPTQPGCIFETAVITPGRTQILRRYRTLADAEKGHREIVAELADENPGAQITELPAGHPLPS